MQYQKLGNSDLNVSRICLGSMTWGEQNTEKEGHQQLDYAIDHGVNFIDTAELYAIPPRAETYGATESIIGNWLKTKDRSSIIIASKIAGPGEGWIDHIREGKSKFNRHHIETALNKSLKRLQTDYIDLYQLHWPERKTNYFGRLGYKAIESDFTPIKETLSILKEQIDAGKIRAIGLSNETPWGVMSFTQAAKEFDLPYVVSVQNPYNLLNRSYEVGLAEVSHRENIPLLAYSPLGFGVLSGKYLNNQKPEGARITKWPDYTRYSSPQSVAATEAYVQIAKEHQLNPAQMALAFINSRPFVGANIIGATTMEQLQQNVASIDISLSEEVLEQIEAVHQRISNPAP